MSSWLPELPDWEGEPDEMPTPQWRKRQWEFIDRKDQYNRYWKTPYHEGDEVVRTYNGEPGHIMAIEEGTHGERYKVTSPSNPVGYTWEWANYLKPTEELPKAPDDLSGLGIPPEGEDYYRNAKVGWQLAKNPFAPALPAQTFSALEDFHQDAAQSLEDYSALARDIMKTLPEEEWPQWVRNLQKPPVQPVDMTPYPHTDVLDTVPGDTTFPDDWSFTSKVQKTAETPANYTESDPLDMENAMQLVNDLDSQWWEQPPDVQRQAIANAFRAALTSPRQNLQWNSIVYQDMQDLGPEVADPDVFENHIRDKKAKWDQFGQQTLDTVERNSDDPEHIAMLQKQQGMSRYMPGIWQNVRNAGIVGPYIEQLRQAALKDVSQGGTGQYFRQALLDMNIPGIGPKIAAFVWLLLCPKTSKIATIDVHMMRALGQKDESPANYSDYLKYEQQLDEQRQAMGYDDVPLGAFQWALWDWQRTPGYHQDHTPLRPLNPTPWYEVDWAPQQRTRTQAPPEVSPDQQQLFSASWKMI